MNASQFNKKYFDYLSEGHYGLDINIPELVEELDIVFQELIKIPGFKYTQIKEKFHQARFYTNLSGILGVVGRMIDRKIEEDLTFFLKVEETISRRNGIEK